MGFKLHFLPPTSKQRPEVAAAMQKPDLGEGNSEAQRFVIRLDPLSLGVWSYPVLGSLRLAHSGSLLEAT